jgi:hypothetical protein
MYGFGTWQLFNANLLMSLAWFLGAFPSLPTLANWVTPDAPSCCAKEANLCTS